MHHIPLGRTGLQVSRLRLGTMTFGLQCDEATSRAILAEQLAPRVAAVAYMAQAGGTEPRRLSAALSSVKDWVEQRLG